MSQVRNEWYDRPDQPRHAEARNTKVAYASVNGKTSMVKFRPRPLHASARISSRARVRTALILKFCHSKYVSRVLWYKILFRVCRIVQLLVLCHTILPVDFLVSTQCSTKSLPQKVVKLHHMVRNRWCRMLCLVNSWQLMFPLKDVRSVTHVFKIYSAKYSRVEGSRVWCHFAFLWLFSGDSTSLDLAQL